MTFSFTARGEYAQTEKALKRMSSQEIFRSLKKYGQEGVNALAAATPKDTGETASAWGYKLDFSRGRYTLSWFNTVMAGDTPLVVLIQYGHGTGTGGYVHGRDFMNPAIQPIFDRISNEVWMEVMKA